MGSRKVYEIYKSTNYCVIDFETTNKEKGSALNSTNDIVLSVVRYGDKKVYKWGGEWEQNFLLDIIYSCDFLVAHNAKFELQWLRRCGLDLSKVLVWCTQVAEYVIAGNRGWELSLESCSKRHGGEGKESVVSKLIKGGVDCIDIPRSLLLSYCIQDVDVTEKLFLSQLRICEELNLLPVVYTRCIFTPVLADIEFNGMELDKELVTSYYNEYTTKLNELTIQLTQLAAINWNSPQQIAGYLYDELKFKELTKYGKPIRTPAGGRSTDSGTISQLRSTTKRQREFKELYLERNKLEALVSKNLEFFYGVVKERDGKFYGQFNQTITKTHRLSASGRKLKFSLFPKEKAVQFQNMPRSFKKLFTFSDKDYLFCEPDGAQLEFRVASHLGRDQQGFKDLLNEEDVHANTARVLTESGQDTSRQEAKAHTFKPLIIGGFKTGLIQGISFN